MKPAILLVCLFSVCLSASAQSSKTDYNAAYTGAPKATEKAKRSQDEVTPNGVKSRVKIERQNQTAATLSNVAVTGLDYGQPLCDKVKKCRLGQILLSDVPEFMQNIVVETINTQCPTIVSNYQTQIVQAKLEEDAEQCVLSLENKSCQSLLQSKGKAVTQQCDTFLSKADKAGIDFSRIQF